MYAVCSSVCVSACVCVCVCGMIRHADGAHFLMYT